MRNRITPSATCEQCRFLPCWLYSPVYGVVLEPCAGCEKRLKHA